MKLRIDMLTEADLPAVDALMKRNSATLGFLPGEALRSFLGSGTVLGAKTEDGVLGGYLLYAPHRRHIRIVHLCVDASLRRQRLAQRLFEELKRSVTTQHEIRLSCRRDFQARHLWRSLDFTAIGEKPGRSAKGTILTIWEYRLRAPDQTDIFDAKVRDSIEVVIDAQVLFHMTKSATANTEPAHQLASDHLVDFVELCVTDEHFNEIERNPDDTLRRVSLEHAQTLRRLTHDREEASGYRAALEFVLPSRTASEKSDITHIANTAASSAGVFVTQDDKLLRNAATIQGITDVRVLHPTSLIIELHKASDPSAYVQSRVSGPSLFWERVGPSDLPAIISALKQQSERTGNLRETLNPFLSNPARYTSEVLRSPDGPEAVRVMEQTGKRLAIPLARVAEGSRTSYFADYLATSAIAHALAQDIPFIEIPAAIHSPALLSACLKAGFLRETDGRLIRFCIPRSVDSGQLVDASSALYPTARERLTALAPLGLANHCSPVDLLEVDLAHFIIPIRPVFATHLLDLRASGDDLFGANNRVLMRWDNVYYRTRTHQHVLQAPGRILWYVSGDRGQIIAVSHLDRVDIGNAKALFREYRKLGVLDWKAVYEMCGRDAGRELMCLKFSHTFPFRQPISLERLREIEGRRAVPLQSPRKVDQLLYTSIFEAGFGTPTA